MIYLDSCAIVKLVHVEPQTFALRAWLTEHGQEPMLSSLLARVEAARALQRTDPAALANLPLVLAAVNLIPIDESICATAAAYPDRLLRSLAAIHLATAALVASELIAFVTYDERLAKAAEAHGLPLVAPA